MILSIFLQRRGVHKNNFLFEFFDNNNLVGTVEKDPKHPAKALLDGNSYSFPLSINKIERKDFDFKYPISKKRDYRLGFKIYKNDEPIAEYYREGAVIGKKGIFKQKIAFDVLSYNKKIYLIFRVGPPKSKSHYYCMIDSLTGETVVILERLGINKDNTRAKLYYENKKNCELAFMLATNELAVNICTNTEGQIVDFSAGKYVSRKKEELEFFDSDFLERVKAMTMF